MNDMTHQGFTLEPTGALFYDAALDEISRDELLAADASTIARLTALYAMEEEEHAKVADCPDFSTLKGLIQDRLEAVHQDFRTVFEVASEK